MSTSLATMSKKTCTDGLTGSLTGTSLVSGKSSLRASFDVLDSRTATGSKVSGLAFIAHAQPFLR